MRTGPILLSMLAALLGAAAPVAPANGEEVPGRALVEERCARCHAIEKTGESPFALAPPLRDLEKRYPLESLEEAFAEGIVVGHPAMPEFEFEPEQIADLVAYLKWLGE